MHPDLFPARRKETRSSVQRILSGHSGCDRLLYHDNPGQSRRGDTLSSATEAEARVHKEGAARGSKGGDAGTH